GRNYAEHAKELSNAIPDEPVLFMKPKTALLQPNIPFYYPEFSNDLPYEVGLFWRIAKIGRYVPEAHAYK
ncbi:fumarylacetoacetate hydrolase family protein, partial [Escherichia coli]|uniref:fumarylacetoacetate hydrolase family protein n=1 Tax=Escherichia coli TaxID=562 RepID=UPI00116B4B72